MRAGRLRHRVTIRNFTSERNNYGEFVQTWHDGETVWAEVIGISGRELVAAGAEMAEATIRVWVRHRSDTTAASRLLCRSGPFAGDVLDITGPPIPDSKCTRLEILCKQGVMR